MKYASIPTKYNGVQFRSRLEARWATFFDLCGWKWEYESVDLNGWIPDFILNDGNTLFVEVKPYFKFEEWTNTIKKIKKTFPEIQCKKHKPKKDTPPVPLSIKDCIERIDCKDCNSLRITFPNYLLLGASIPASGTPISSPDSCIGYANFRNDWFEPVVFYTDFFSNKDIYCNRMYNGHHLGRTYILDYEFHYSGKIIDEFHGKYTYWPEDRETLLNLWRKAGNKIQWKGVRQ